MIAEFDGAGKWWIPNNGNIVFGNISFKPSDGINLQLSEPFRATPEIESASIIWGLLDNGKKITLYDSFIKTSTISNGTCTVKYTSNHLFIGSHFNSPNEIVFSSISVRFPYLEQWLRFQFYKNDNKSISYDSQMNKYEVSALKSTISFASNITTSYTFAKKVCIENNSSIIIEPDTPKDYEWYLMVLYDIQNFLALNLGAPVIPLQLTGNTPQQEKVEIYFLLKDYSVKEKAPRSLIYFPSYGDLFQSCLNNWFTKQDRLRTAADLLLGTYYSSSMHPFLTFLVVTQSLEAYHRHVHNGYYISKSEYDPCYKAMIAAIPSNIASDHRDSLKSRVKYGYEYSLRKRLSLILGGPCKEIFDDFIDGHSVFINSVIDTRNYLTHYDNELEARAVTGIDLYYLTQKLKTILIILLLYEIGLPTITIEACIKSHDHYVELKLKRQ